MLVNKRWTTGSTVANGVTRLAKKLGVSRQRAWQIIKKAEGRCETCGMPKITSRYCEKHAIAERKRKRESKGHKPWRLGSKGRKPQFGVGQ